MGGINRFFSNGNDYTHTYTTWFGGIQANLYLKRWSISGNIDSRYRSLFGETIWHNEYSSNLNLSYKLRGLQIGIGYMFPLQPKGLNSGERMNSKFVQKEKWNTIKDYGNMITFNVAWNFNSGRKYKEIEKRVNNSDKETGIVK